VFEELGSSIIVTNALVHMKLVEELRDSLVSRRSQLLAVNSDLEIIVALLVLEELELDEVRVSFPQRLEDDPATPDMSLHPQLLVHIEVLKTDKSTTDRRQVRHVVDIVPLLLVLLLEENLEGTIKVRQVKGHGVRATLFIPRVELAELLTPRLTLQIECGDGLTSERIHCIFVEIDFSVVLLGEKFAGSMADQFMECHLQEKGILAVFADQF